MMQKKTDEIEKYMKDCTLCPRNCHADRMAGRTGYCGMTDKIYAARAALHMWEEPCISGCKGSGAVFFTGCGLRCCFCQNREIAIGKDGCEIDVKRLAEIFLELQDKGAANINLVTGAHYVPQITAALDIAGEQGMGLPVVYNSSGYEKVETLKLLEGYVDVYLPDYKYADPLLAQQFSHAADYPEIVGNALAEMVRQTGPVVFDEEGYIKKGTIVRHLILPGHTRNSIQVLKYLQRAFGTQVYISIMNQYTPLPQVADIEVLNRTVTPEEYDRVLRFAERIGIERGFRQEGTAASESFIPEFDERGL